MKTLLPKPKIDVKIGYLCVELGEVLLDRLQGVSKLLVILRDTRGDPCVMS
jgi:hypothetical protein